MGCVIAQCGSRTLPALIPPPQLEGWVLGVGAVLLLLQMWGLVAGTRASLYDFAGCVASVWR